MTWEAALEEVVARTKHERFRDFCADNWPEHEACRAHMIRLATGEPDPAAHLPEDLALQAYVATHSCQPCH